MSRSFYRWCLREVEDHLHGVPLVGGRLEGAHRLVAENEATAPAGGSPWSTSAISRSVPAHADEEGRHHDLARLATRYVRRGWHGRAAPPPLALVSRLSPARKQRWTNRSMIEVWPTR